MSEALSPALLKTVEQKALHAGKGNSWACYAAILRYVTALQERLPSSEAIEACDEDDMDHILEAELEHLAQTVTEIFPGQGPVELAYYAPRPRRKLIE